MLFCCDVMGLLGGNLECNIVPVAQEKRRPLQAAIAQWSSTKVSHVMIHDSGEEYVFGINAPSSLTADEHDAFYGPICHDAFCVDAEYPSQCPIPPNKKPTLTSELAHLPLLLHFMGTNPSFSLRFHFLGNTPDVGVVGADTIPPPFFFPPNGATSVGRPVCCAQSAPPRTISSD